MWKGYKNSQGNGGFSEKNITSWISREEEDSTVSMSRQTPPQTASDSWDWPTG